MSEYELKKPKVKLIGKDGNAFAILGACKRIADKAKWKAEKWKEFQDEATNGDYNHLLCTVTDYFDVS
jgi:hypothetical protein